jgi:hypothetical protein
MKKNFKLRAGPNKKEIMSLVDTLIIEIESAKNNLDSLPSRGSVDLQQAEVIARHLHQMIKKQDESSIDWFKVFECVCWIVEVVEKFITFLSYFSLQRHRNYNNAYRSNHQTNTGHGRSFSRCAC